MTNPQLVAWGREICPTDPIDSGIVRAVMLLREAGFTTFESCEGMPPLSRNTRGHCYAEPTVRFFGTVTDGFRAVRICEAAGLPIGGLRRVWDYHHSGAEDAPGQLFGLDEEPTWEIVFRVRLD